MFKLNECACLLRLTLKINEFVEVEWKQLLKTSKYINMDITNRLM